MKNLSIAFVATLSLLSFAGCKKKADSGGGGAMAKMVEFKDKMCGCADKKDKDCAQKVTEEMTKWAQDSAKNNPAAATPNAADAKKMEEVGKQLGECTTKAMMPDAGGTMADPGSGSAAATPTEGSGSAAAAPAGSGSGDTAAAAPGGADTSNYPQECKDYMAAFEALSKCDKLGPAKDSMKQGYDATVDAWKNFASATDDATKKAWSDGCTAGLDGLKQTAGAMGCTL